VSVCGFDCKTYSEWFFNRNFGEGSTFPLGKVGRSSTGLHLSYGCHLHRHLPFLYSISTPKHHPAQSHRNRASSSTNITEPWSPCPPFFFGWFVLRPTLFRLLFLFVIFFTPFLAIPVCLVSFIFTAIFGIVTTSIVPSGAFHVTSF